MQTSFSHSQLLLHFRRVPLLLLSLLLLLLWSIHPYATITTTMRCPIQWPAAAVTFFPLTSRMRSVSSSCHATVVPHFPYHYIHSYLPCRRRRSAHYEYRVALLEPTVQQVDRANFYFSVFCIHSSPFCPAIHRNDFIKLNWIITFIVQCLCQESELRVQAGPPAQRPVGWLPILLTAEHQLLMIVSDGGWILGWHWKVNYSWSEF